MDKAQEFINQEETLLVLLGFEPSRASTSEMPKKKKKVDREESSDKCQILYIWIP
jgi:hypothetical protein